MAKTPDLKIILLGSSGQVGSEWCRLLGRPPSGHEEAWTAPAPDVEDDCRLHVLAPSHRSLDLADPQHLREWLSTQQADIVINAAAYTAVDKAEAEPMLARAINATAPTVLAQWAQASGACLLHYSTDYVFDGLAQHAYLEGDPTNPLSVYGSTKADGERGIQQHLTRHLILRTSWVMGVHGGNFLKTMLRLATERDSLRVVADQYGVPTPARLLAQQGWRALRHCLQAEHTGQQVKASPWGLYHLTTRGVTTWFDYAAFVIGTAQTRGWPILAGPERIQPITTAQYPTPARRPANSRLDISRFEQTFNGLLPTWQESVLATLDELGSIHP